MLSFKSYQEIDVATLHGLRYDMYSEVFGQNYSNREKGIKNLNRLLKYDPRFSWSVWDGDTPVAFLNVESGEYLGEQVAYLNLLGVLPAYRKQGLGSKLMALSAQSSAEAGCRLNFLESVAAHSHVWQHYERIGWEITRSFRCYEASSKPHIHTPRERIPKSWTITPKREYVADDYSYIDQYPASWIWRPETMPEDGGQQVVLELHDESGCFAYVFALPMRASIVRMEAAREEDLACSILLEAITKRMLGDRMFFYHLDSRRVALCQLLESSGFKERLFLHEMVRNSRLS